MKKRILIVEDEKDLAGMLSKSLLFAGYEVMTSLDAVSALSQTRQFRPDLILLDMTLPGGGGQSVLRRLKLSTHTNQIPVLLSTAMGHEDCKKKIGELKVEGYLQKPYSSNAVVSAIRKILNVGPFSA